MIRELTQQDIAPGELRAITTCDTSNLEAFRWRRRHQLHLFSCCVLVDLAASLLPDLADVLRYQSFPQAGLLRENIFRQLIITARRLGRQRFKQHMELFLEPLFESALEDGVERHGVRMSARACLRAFDELLGRDIFVGRLPDHLKEAFLADPGLSA